jgi:hypothetical protein
MSKVNQITAGDVESSTYVSQIILDGMRRFNASILLVNSSIVWNNTMDNHASTKYLYPENIQLHKKSFLELKGLSERCNIDLNLMAEYMIALSVNDVKINDLTKQKEAVKSQ